MSAVPGPRALRTTVVIDYQNVHLIGHGVFDREGCSPSATRIRPMLFAQRLIERRNERQQVQGRGYPLARLEQVKVFRGLPSERYDRQGYLRGLTEQQAWNRDDPRVDVQCRTLQYIVRRDWSADAEQSNPRTRVLVAREKGIDVLCALAVADASYDPNIDLIIVASHDSDLVPAIEAVQRTRRARIEGFQWWGEQPGPQLRSEERTFWVTRLDEDDFLAVRETRDLHSTTNGDKVDGLVEAFAGHHVRVGAQPRTPSLFAPSPAAAQIAPESTAVPES